MKVGSLIRHGIPHASLDKASSAKSHGITNHLHFRVQPQQCSTIEMSTHSSPALRGSHSSTSHTRTTSEMSIVGFAKVPSGYTSLRFPSALLSYVVEPGGGCIRPRSKVVPSDAIPTGASGLTLLGYREGCGGGDTSVTKSAANLCWICG